ncbi:hypothetical protein BT96DRAFT_1012708 [Gymnopus androsaceus JB14]|uniref:Glycan binding protein Y3-like domain-containing protein n=1 Tax=Gymnopus androsaceus JB14 TaxID=1447944 RepID=A0A6A4IHA3_9AGAR|nr:hypothetical protein BT96DRAFT_1012708 [Gymnopus androsaceus JB14]
MTLKLNAHLAFVVFGLSVLRQCLGQDVEINCFETGQVGSCSSFVTTFCGYTVNNAISPSNSLSACFNNGDFSCAFTAFNTNTGDVASIPSTVGCEEILDGVGVLCPMGGQGQFEGPNYLFTAHPTVGSCTTDST